VSELSRETVKGSSVQPFGIRKLIALWIAPNGRAIKEAPVSTHKMDKLHWVRFLAVKINFKIV
jgi:hypothetical protein